MENEQNALTSLPFTRLQLSQQNIEQYNGSSIVEQ